MNDHHNNIYERTNQQSVFHFIGNGELGGKASGLVKIQEVLEKKLKIDNQSGISVSIPHMTVIRTDIFDEFMRYNDLYPLALSCNNDSYLAHEFQKAGLPASIVGDLRDLISRTTSPIAVRSSSLLEDSSDEPFAGVYATKMLPNNQSDKEMRFHKLVQAIKFVYSSLFFSDSSDYFAKTGRNLREEKMAVIIQEVVGNRYDNHFYPVLSGVGRSFNYYPQENNAREDGVVNLAMGLGKTIVDGGRSWIYCPKNPRKSAPYNNTKELLDNSQRTFWSVKLDMIKEFNPVSEVEFMEELPLDRCDTRLQQMLCSTYDHLNDRFSPGIASNGARLIDFASILKYKEIELNSTVKKLLDICKKYYESEVEIEFALEKQGASYHLGFLQVRSMEKLSGNNQIDLNDYPAESLLAVSKLVLGDGRKHNIRDIVFVKPDNFDAAKTREIAREIADLNRKLTSARRPYLLIGFGRWGSSDHWLGIPVSWSMISGAEVIVESSLPQMKPDMSQGSHFFHNLIAFGVFYLSIRDNEKICIDWEWLQQQTIIEETEHVCYVQCEKALDVIMDSINNQGVILK